MKLSNLLFVVFLLISSFGYCDIVSDLQAKKNNTQETGIYYNVVVPGDYDGKKLTKYSITEKEGNKLFESSKFDDQMYLLTDGKLFQIPSSAELDPMAPTTVILLGEDVKAKIGEYDKKFQIPDYTNANVLGATKINGYKCQILQKIISSKEIKDKDKGKVISQNLLNIYVIEKNGYPTRIESIVRTQDMKGNEIKSEIKNSIDFVKFRTNIITKFIAIPKNAIVVNAVSPVSFDKNSNKTHQQQILKENNEYK